MRILFITDDFGGASLCARLHHEGHDVCAYVVHPAYTRTLDGWIRKIADLEDGLSWVGTDGLVVCDDNGFGKLADDLRARELAIVVNIKCTCCRCIRFDLAKVQIALDSYNSCVRNLQYGSKPDGVSNLLLLM